MRQIFTADPEIVAATLEEIRQQRCLYGAHAMTCDCKYANIGLMGTPLGRGESSGCPELRQAIWAVREMGKRQADEAEMARRLKVSQVVADLQQMFRDLDEGRIFIEDFDPRLLERLRRVLNVEDYE